MVKDSKKSTPGFFRRLFGTTTNAKHNTRRVPSNSQSTLSLSVNQSGVGIVSNADNSNVKNSPPNLNLLSSKTATTINDDDTIPIKPTNPINTSSSTHNGSNINPKHEPVSMISNNTDSTLKPPNKPLLALAPVSPFVADFIHSKHISDEVMIPDSIAEDDKLLSTNSTTTDLTTPDTSGGSHWNSHGSPSSSISSIPRDKTDNDDTITTITTPMIQSEPEQNITIPQSATIPQSPEFHQQNATPTSIAEQLYNHTATFVNEEEYASWLGSDEEKQEIREEYMDLFDFENKSILAALRLLCDKLYMKGESQQLNRVIESFSQAWVSQNPTHGFGDSNVVYTITYALVLLNTDLYAADHTATKKMSRSVFVQNTLETVRALRPTATTTPLQKGHHHHPSFSPILSRKSEDFGGKRLSIMSTNFYDSLLLVQDNSLEPMSKEWEFHLENILKSFYSSVSKEPLKLHILENAPFSPLSRIYSPTNHDHTPSIISSPAIQSSGSSIFGRMNFKLRGNKHLEPHQSRIGITDRTSDSFRHDSLASSYSFETSLSNNFSFTRHAIGFAGLLWDSIKEENSTTSQTSDDEDNFADFSKIEKELADEVELELQGAPWAKEGILLYRPYVDPTTGKKPKKKDWIKVFMVVQRGQLKMFKFDMSSTHTTVVNGVVGGGNWMENAQLVDGFHLCHTLAQELPQPKKNHGFDALWSLTLPQRGLLVFQAGTPEVAKEFVYTCNYWAGRLSKEPFEDPVSSMEFGWGSILDECNTGLASSVSTSTLRRNSSSNTHRVLPGDRLNIREWKPSGHNMVVSDLDEKRQLKNLQVYIKRAENDLTEHNGLSSKLAKAYTPASTNWNKAHANWEKKSQFLLQQVIRYKTYVEVLDKAIIDRNEKLPHLRVQSIEDMNDSTVEFNKSSDTPEEKLSSLTINEHQVLTA